MLPFPSDTGVLLIFLMMKRKKLKRNLKQCSELQLKGFYSIYITHFM